MKLARVMQPGYMGNTSTTFPCTVLNSIVGGQGNAALEAAATGQITEDYNLLPATTPRTNVSVGASSISGHPSPYALLFEIGQALLRGASPRPFLSPMLGSPALGFGNSGGPTTDILGLTRPSGPALTWANALASIGAYERGNTGQKEVTTVRTGSNALKLLGPSCQDFDLAVGATSTTVTVYGRYDSAYGAGTLPSMRVLANGEIGIAEATATMTGAANTWEQLSLNFTPTASGLITVRLMSAGDGDGSAFFDDFAVA